MSGMVRWFSFRRLLLWICVSGGILLILVLTGRVMRRDALLLRGRRQSSLLKLRKAQLRHKAQLTGNLGGGRRGEEDVGDLGKLDAGRRKGQQPDLHPPYPELTRSRSDEPSNQADTQKRQSKNQKGKNTRTRNKNKDKKKSKSKNKNKNKKKKTAKGGKLESEDFTRGQGNVTESTGQSKGSFGSEMPTIDLPKDLGVLPPSLPENVMEPFKMHLADIEIAFRQWDSKGGETLTVYLWRRYRVRALPEDTRDEDGLALSASKIFEISIRRHVALFYGQYLLRGGTEPRHFPMPVCSDIYLGNHLDEASSQELDDLAGSQGTLVFKRLPYHLDGERPPFQLDQNGNFAMITKYFKVNRRNHSSSQNKHKGTGKHYEHSYYDDPSETHHLSKEEKQKRREADDRKASEHNFAKELYALSTVNHPHVLQPVCYERQPELRMIYPLIYGGDLIPLDSDHLRWRHPFDASRYLNPDEAFLPRFFRQLVEAVYAVHQYGILHLDLKPENLVISGPDRKFYLPADSNAMQHYSLVLLDFGLAERLEDARREKCIRTGTDVTMAPEQMLCNAPAGRGTDWWGVAAAMWRTRVFWEPTLTNQHRDELLHAKCPQWGHPILPPQPFFSPDFQELLDMMLKPDPADRDFSRSSQTINKLLDSNYLLRGLSPELRTQRLMQLERERSSSAASGSIGEETGSSNGSGARSLSPPHL